MIYFCIPAHNEERTVGVVLWKLRQVMAELGRDYQIIVVDDASTDSTPAVLSPYIRVLPLTVFRNPERLGYADSLEIALREAVRRAAYPKRDAVIALQADFTEDPDVVPALVKRVEAGADVVAADIELEPGEPRAVRWGRRLFRWLLRGREWAAVGDPLCGLRAYRVMVLKRALEQRGEQQRLLSWSGVGANAELLEQVIPHSRRNDVIETTLRTSRRQRPSRFVFLTALREVRGAASGRPSAHARALPAEVAMAAPAPIAASDRGVARDGERDGRRQGRRPGDRSGARQTQGRERRPQRTERGGSRQKSDGSRPARPARPAVAAAAAPPEDAEKKKRRRTRRRKKRAPEGVQGTNGAAAPEPAEAAAPESTGDAAVPAGEAGAPRKKSRRGRRGGRGRRRGKSPNATNTNETSENGATPPPPTAAEGE